MRLILREPKKIVPLFVAALFFFTIYISVYPYMGRTLFYPLYREIKKQSFTLSNHQFNSEENEDFRIFYKDDSTECVEMVLNNAEKSLNAVINDFHYKPDGRIDIVVYSDYKEMANKIGLGTGSTAMGVYYGGMISILEPEKWINKGYNMVYIFNKEGPILHELTHYVIDYQSGGNVPVWFTEGVALYEEYRINDVEWGTDKVYETYYSPEELERDFYKLDETKAYRQSFLIVKYIADSYGMECINNIIKGLSTGKPLNQVFVDVLKMKTSDIFKKSLLQVNLPASFLCI